MTPATATRLASEEGDRFDGAQVLHTAFYVATEANVALTSTRLPLPADVDTVFVAGLAPRATYEIVVENDAAERHLRVTPAPSGTAADAAGLVRFPL